MDATFIKQYDKGLLQIHTENTGGYVMCDFIVLTDGKLLVISEDGIGLYNDMDHFESGNDPLSYIER